MKRFYNYKCECGVLVEKMREEKERLEPIPCLKCGKDMKFTFEGQVFGGQFGQNDKYRNSQG